MDMAMFILTGGREHTQAEREALLGRADRVLTAVHSAPGSLSIVEARFLRGRPRSVTAQASELRECETGITPFDCPRDNSFLDCGGTVLDWQFRRHFVAAS